MKCRYIESLHLDPALSVHCEEGVVGDTPITEKIIMHVNEISTYINNDKPLLTYISTCM